MHVDVIGGFLGSGKTTAILNLIEQGAFDPRKTVLLVNEFGQVGVDGALLGSGEGAVRELASGCICCSLKADFMLQIQEIAEVLAPEHLVVEPSGVASMRDILQAVTHERIAGLVDDIRTVLILDVADYDWFTQMSETFVNAQIGLAQLILLNKTDLAEWDAIAEVTADLERRNPDAVVLPTAYGVFSWDDVLPLLPPLPSPEGPTARLDGYEAFSRVLPETFHREALRSLFRAIAEGRFGDVRRAKGVFIVEDGCVRIDLASGRIQESPWSCAVSGRVNVIGQQLDEPALQDALAGAVAVRAPQGEGRDRAGN